MKTSRRLREAKKHPERSPQTNTKIAMTIILLAASAFLLFFNLGHYALWDDEVGLAVPALNVWTNGDTGIVYGNNILAARQGIIVRNLKDRANPPLPAYLMAPFVTISGSPLFARLPMALCGLATVAIMILWLWRARASMATWLLMTCAIIGNVSFFLFARQARYYGLTMLLSLAAAYTYLHWKGSKRGLLAFSLLLSGLLASHYMTFAAFIIAMAADYFFWHRKKQRLSFQEWLLVLGPLACIGSMVVLVWNPLLTGITEQAASNDLADRLTLFFWNLRDLSAGELGAGILLLLVPVLCFLGQGPVWLLRGMVFIVVYCLAMGLASPQPLNITFVADIRYLAPLIPLCMFLGVLVIQSALRGAPLIGLACAGILIFGTNLPNGGGFLGKPFRSTLISYIGELLDPPSDPFSVTSSWINQNVQENESIWVQPDYMAFPLIYHAPKAIYAWQLSWPPKEQFAHLPAIHFAGRVPPDYIIAFGPVVEPMTRLMAQWKSQNLSYSIVATLDYFWKDLYRPELFWRTFKPITGYNKEMEAIYVFKRQTK